MEVVWGVGGLNFGKRRGEFGEARDNSSGMGLNLTGEGRMGSSRRWEICKDVVRIPQGGNGEESLGDKSNSEGKLGGGVGNCLLVD